jgi:GntR family transcriptional regulator, rspAB operon transcriptional repressor
MTVLPAISDSRDPSKTERVYADLRRRIRELVVPPGAALRKEEIALALGVSRAPVSEAIARLADEGLVDVFPQHGSFVAPIRATEVRESLFIRTALETEAMRRLAPAAGAGLLRTLDANLAAQERALTINDLAQFYDLDEALHAAIFAAVESPRASRLLDAARAPLDRVRRMALPEEERPQQTLAEHRRLVDAIRSGDGEFAAAAMRTHLAMVARSIERKLPQIESNNG